MEGELRLPLYFPRTTKECKDITMDFFSCFTEEGEKKMKGDRESGQVGLQKCKTQFTKYKECMDKTYKPLEK
jgi:hypothetical protein